MNQAETLEVLAIRDNEVPSPKQEFKPGDKEIHSDHLIEAIKELNSFEIRISEPVSDYSPDQTTSINDWQPVLSRQIDIELTADEIFSFTSQNDLIKIDDFMQAMELALIKIHEKQMHLGKESLKLLDLNKKSVESDIENKENKHEVQKQFNDQLAKVGNVSHMNRKSAQYFRAESNLKSIYKHLLSKSYIGKIEILEKKYFNKA